MNLTKHWAAQLDDYVIDLAWSPVSTPGSASRTDEPMLAAASTAGPVSVFSAQNGARRHELPGHPEGTNCLAWQPAVTAALATGGQDGCVKFWDATAGQHTGTAELGADWIEHLGWRPHAPASQPSVVSAQASAPSSPLSAPNSSLLFAAAGKSLFALRADASIAHQFKSSPKTISALAWQPAGGCAAVAYFGGVGLWDADDFIAQKEFPYGNGIHALVWSPDGKWLVSGNQDPSVHLWIPETDTEFHMSGYESKVKHLSFSCDSRWLATGGGRDACVWDCEGGGPEGREPAMFPHDAPVCAVAFQNTHGVLATASNDGVVQLWSPERKQPLRATIRMPAAATKLVWSPDDTQLAIGSEKGIVYVLKCEA